MVYSCSGFHIAIRSRYAGAKGRLFVDIAPADIRATNIERQTQSGCVIQQFK